MSPNHQSSRIRNQLPHEMRGHPAKSSTSRPQVVAVDAGIELIDENWHCSRSDHEIWT